MQLAMTSCRAYEEELLLAARFLVCVQQEELFSCVESGQRLAGSLKPNKIKVSEQLVPSFITHQIEIWAFAWYSKHSSA